MSHHHHLDTPTRLRPRAPLDGSGVYAGPLLPVAAERAVSGAGPAGRWLAMTAPRWVIPALVVVTVALVAAADRLASSGPLGFAATAALLLGAPALVVGLSRLSSRRGLAR